MTVFVLESGAKSQFGLEFEQFLCQVGRQAADHLLYELLAL